MFFTVVRQQSGEERHFAQQGGEYNKLWSKYQPGRRPSGPSADGKWVFVDPHVLSTPVIADFSGSGNENELIVTVNFYFSKDRYGFLQKFKFVCMMNFF